MGKELILTTEKLLKIFPAKGRQKKKGQDVVAVKGITLSVKTGQIFGFLGPNGAGKTTSLQMLTTILAPTSGNATLVGFNLKTHPFEIRKRIGYVSQQGGADTSTNAKENLLLQAQLYGLSFNDAKERSDELLKRFELTEFADRKVTSYSGGQKRRLDLALGVIHRPQLLFLDEPTTGLDPQSRAHFWDEIRRINTDGTTVFLTTHYLDEADNLCGYIAIMDHGEVVDEGTPDDLKRKTGGDRIGIGIEGEEVRRRAKEIIEKEMSVEKILIEEGKIHIYLHDGEKRLADVLRLLDAQAIVFQAIELSKPSLDDVFLQRTGRSLRDAA